MLSGTRHLNREEAHRATSSEEAGSLVLQFCFGFGTRERTQDLMPALVPSHTSGPILDFCKTSPDF